MDTKHKGEYVGPLCFWTAAFVQMNIFILSFFFFWSGKISPYLDNNPPFFEQKAAFK